MEQSLNAPQITQSSPMWDGDPLAPWMSVRAYFASKTCAACTRPFTPKLEKGYKGKMRYEAEVSFNRRQFCGKSCAKKQKNPMHSESSRLKMQKTLKKIGHKPLIRAGNGTGLTKTQSMVAQALGHHWHTEVVICTLKSSKQGYPHHYKVDVANKELMIAIELDGRSHGATRRQMQDQKKDALLRSLGWKVLRLKNEQAMNLCTTYGSQVTPHILRMAS
jgi:very-short-patch-repair endonuclease